MSPSVAGGRPPYPDVLVIGGGVIGAAILYELARRGLHGHLIERGRFGMESTGKSAAIVRMHYSNAPVVRMALRSRDVFESLPEMIGSDVVYSKTGWWFAVPNDALDAVRETAVMNRAQGVEVLVFSPADAATAFPGLVDDGVAAMFLEPGSGFANPLATTLGFIRAACSLGATAEENVAALGLKVGQGKVTGVETTGGLIPTGTVVLAAGPWSAKVAATAGVDLPIRVTRELELYLVVPSELRPRAPMSNLADRIYVRPMLASEGYPDAMIVGRGYPKPYEFVDPDSYDDGPSADFEADVRARLGARLPGLATQPRVGGVSGLYAVTPDWHPYLGPIDELQNLVLATGGSGHCFKLAPAIGDMVAAHLVGQSVDYADIDLFNLRRIHENRCFGAAIGGNRA